ncbi:MAG: thiamine pyrophosphate-dependent enzyme, partial [Pseudomonadota bacterium]|nr:thiamine pyrophosphate-dependent enzyme [Pseudomonadota bacterium]
AETAGIPVAATQAGKSSLVEAHPMYVGSLGVTGASAANNLAAKADVVLSVGSRLQDFTTGSNSLISGQVVALNVQPHDLVKHGAMPLMADALNGIEALAAGMAGYRTDDAYQSEIAGEWQGWTDAVDAVCRAPSDSNSLPSDSEVIGAVNRACPAETIVVGAAGSMPGELHKLWQVGAVDGYHMEYGFSCMGYEVAAGIGVDMAAPDRPNVVFAGDGSYLMLNAELATAVMMGTRMTLIITDNRGFGCINRLQAGTGGAAFNNLFVDSRHEVLPEIDFVAHAASMGARAQKAGSIAELESMAAEAIGRDGVDVIVIDTDPGPSTAAGGTWWEVGVPEVSDRAEVASAYEGWLDGKKRQLMRGE